MATRDQITLAKSEELKRRSERVLLRIPIEVKGTAADGKPFREKTYTLVINRDGARISLRNSPRPGDQVLVTNRQNEISCPFRVVGRTGTSRGEGPEWGVECLRPDLNLWGIYFPKKVEAPQEQKPIDTLLECSGCPSRELAPLTMEQYQLLNQRTSINRHCKTCGAMTAWKLGFVEFNGEEVAAAQAGSTPPATVWKEPRRAKRLTAKLPIRIRMEDGREAIARTENLSTIGACFVSSLEMIPGDRILVTVGYTAGSNQAEISAQVVWRRQLEGLTSAVYGVRLEESRQGSEASQP